FLFDLAIDLLFSQPHALQRAAHTHIRTKHSGSDSFLEAREQFHRTGRSARANQSLSFPVLRGVQVITHRFLQRTSECSIAAVRAQAQVDTIRCAFAAGLAYESRGCFGEFDEVLAITDLAAFACAGCRAVVGVKKNEI